MSTPKPPEPAKLVIGMFMKDKALFEQVAEILSEKYGPVDMVSPWLNFDYTCYYEAEMGGPLFRRVLAFENLIQQEMLADIKLYTNNVEKNISGSEKRIINIDPGYLLHAQFILATGKNFSHRIYIGKNIYADLTLMYRKGKFQTLPWTYPDYASEEMMTFLEKVRAKYSYNLTERQKS
ncbi:MAG: DUF4416 family protein [Desulfobacterales bacterium]|nr:DUF4416 family protein [Desulfobacterales bacterium]